MSRKPQEPPRGRGSLSWQDNRFDSECRESISEGEGEHTPLQTQVLPDTARAIITENSSPDVGFSRSINPYRGCEHGCVYCFARPTHAYLGLSPGLDFESRLFYKKDAAALLKKELSKKGYSPHPIALGINTDSYQPIEEKLNVTRSVLEILSETNHPVTIVTKSALIERDLDLLRSMARRSLVHVFLSITSLDQELTQRLEPRAAAPYRRLQTMRRLSNEKIPTGVLVAPVIPRLTEHELERILEASKEAGALAAGYVLLRLPLELKEIFEEWLRHHRPDGAKAILGRLREFHGGELYRSGFGERMSGTGPMADLLAKRFEIAERRLGFSSLPSLDSGRFTPPQQKRPFRLFSHFNPTESDHRP